MQRGAAKMQHRGRGSPLSQLSWDDLRFFLVCAECGSFRKAGKLLKVDSATIVRKISRLEAAVGLRLFNRLTDGVTLTDEGCSVAGNARAMQRAAASIERQSQISALGVRGHVRVAITEGVGTYWVLPRLLDFQKANRRLTFDLQATMEHTDIGRLEADMSVQFLRPERPDLISVRLGHLHIYPFASFGYRELYGLPSSLEDARRHRIIQQAGPLLQPGLYERVLGVDSLEGIVGVVTNSSAAVLYAVERDAGIGMLPTYAPTLGAKLIPVELGFSHRLELWLTYHPDLRNSPRHMVVVEWLRRIFDPVRFPCFGESFIHPSELPRLLSDAAAINYAGGFASAHPESSLEIDVDEVAL
ncbi:MAG: LysR family transcriptional regulator [Methylocystis sp.]